MKKSAALTLTLILATSAVCIPIAIAIQQSVRQALETESARVLGYARDVLHRSDMTADQIAHGIGLLTAEKSNDPCSDAQIAVMRRVDLASSYVQAIAVVKNNRIICSSLGADMKDVDIGPPDVVTSRGSAIRTHVRLPMTGVQEFIGIEQEQIFVLIHKDLPIDVTTYDQSVALAIYSSESPIPLSFAGSINPNWASRIGQEPEITFRDGSYLVAVVQSKRYMTLAIAAIPTSDLDKKTWAAARHLVPAGMLAAVALATAIVYLARMQLALPSSIRAGLRRNEFYLVYQPIVDLQSGSWVGVEALLRWRRSTGELVSPDLFIAVAEQSNLILRLTNRVLELAAHDMAGLMREGFHLAINLSAADLQSPEFARSLKTLVNALAIPPGNLILEVTERRLVNAEVARRLISDLRKQGVGIAVDDFGTGYSSLSYLHALELDFLKIDKSFTEAIGTEGPTSHVVSHIIRMAKDLRLGMIAEGVETEAQANYMRDNGVQFAQGWLFSKPLSADELRTELQESKRASSDRGPV